MHQGDRRIPEQDPLAFLAGGGEMGERTRAFDWSKTPVGPVAGWPHSLKTAVRIMLDARYPMFLWWGPEFTKFYNDAYAPALGQRHPDALARSAAEVWSEIWHVVGPQAEAVLTEGRATWSEEQLLVMERNHFLEETYFTYSYSPVPNDAGGVGGVFGACTEETSRVLGQRRLRTLRALAERAAQAKTVVGACEGAAATLSENQHDLPFVLLYLLDDDGKRARLAGLTGVGRDEPASPAAVDLDDRSAAWPFRQVVETGKAVAVDDLAARFKRLPGGVWPESPQRAMVVPMARPGQARLAGFVVAGISPRLQFNDDYKGFFDLLAGHVATAVANARAHEEERRRAEALAELDRAKTTFFSNVSHEFRTPLTLMLGPVADALAGTDGELPPPQRERLEVVHRNGLRLQRLVNTLLDFSRIEAGRVQASYEPIDLAAFTAELASNFRSACEKAGLELQVDCPPLSEPVFVDRQMWEKIVLNLLSNAFKFTFAGEIAVSVRQVGDTAEVRVHDTGAGIPPEAMPRLFERFHRVENARGRTHEGSGIGLALVHELVRLHGGSITAASEVGKGTTFVLLIPLGSKHLPREQVASNRTAAAPTTGARPFVEEALHWLPLDDEDGTRPDLTTCPEESALVDSGRQQTNGTRPRILVADDNADMRRYIVRLLAGQYTVEAVPDGAAALAAMRQRPPDLLLTDVMMPQLDGFGLLRELRADARTRGLPIILLSARAGEESQVEGMEAGADDYLVKPFSARELQARVGALLQINRLRRESEHELRQAQDRLRQSEEKFRSFAENGPQMIWSANGDGVPDYLNPRWCDYTGLTLEQTANPNCLQKVIHPDDLPQMLDQWAVAKVAGTPFEVEFRLKRASDGAYRWFLCRSVPVRDSQGKIVQWIGANADIDDQKRAEAALREADRRKDEFLATLAHELRNPLAPIRNSVQVMRLRGLDDPQLEWARDVIERQAQQMTRLVDDLLDISRITRGKVQLKTEVVDLADVVRRAIETARPLIVERHHHLTLSLSAQAVRLEADPARLEQILANLLNNAAKYTEPHGHITLVVEPGETHVAVRVRDDGIGIGPDLLPRVFDMFVQAEPGKERTKGGLGIGLSLVQRLVELHGGSVSAHSDGPGRGSEFVVRLPVLKTWDGQAASPSGLPEASPRAAGCRILVVDDNVDAANSLALLLRLGGHQVRVVHDGESALEVMQADVPELLFLDIELPGMDGYQVARKLRQQPWAAATVLVALTGWGQEEDRRHSKEAGFDYHLVKPVDLDLLNEILASVREEVKEFEVI